MLSMICESLPYSVHECTLPTSGPRNFQYRIQGRHPFSSILQLRTSGCDKYYRISTTTILFYDFFLTLADEVSHVMGVSSRHVY